MLRTIPAPLSARLANEVTTLCRIWRVTRRDGQVFGFTDHVQDLVVGGRTYRSVNTAETTALEATSELAPANGEATLLAQEPLLERDIANGVWHLATVEVELVDYTAPGDGVVKLQSGELGQVRIEGGRVSVELRGFKHRLGKPVGRTVQPTCDADLGDARCRVTLGPLTVSGTVTAVTDAAQFTDAARTESTGWFDGGLLTWTSGLNAGRRMEVKRFQSGGAFTLFLPLAYPIAVGDGYSLYPGCDKTFSICVSKFNNGVNYQGFPFVPGNQAIRNGGTA